MGRRGSVSHLARPASCPAPPTSQPQHYGERVRLRRGRRSVFPAKPRPKLWAFISAPRHLATSLTCFPLLGHLLGFQTRLCFHFASLPFNFCPEFRPGFNQRVSSFIYFHQALRCEALLHKRFSPRSTFAPGCVWFVAAIVCGHRRWDGNSIKFIWAV